MLKQRRRQGFAALLAVPLCAVEGFSFLSRPVLLKDRGSRAGVKIFSRSDGADGPPPLPPGFDVVPGDDPWAEDDDPFASRMDAGGRDMGAQPSRLAAMMAQAEQRKEMQQSEDVWEPQSGLTDEARAAAEKRDAEARLQAQADGFDPEDEESMKLWRREQAKKARQRMAANAAGMYRVPTEEPPEPGSAEEEWREEQAKSYKPSSRLQDDIELGNYVPLDVDTPISPSASSASSASSLSPPPPPPPPPAQARAEAPPETAAAPNPTPSQAVAEEPSRPEGIDPRDDGAVGGFDEGPMGGSSSQAAARLAMMRATSEDSKELEGIVGSWDNDDYINSLRRPKEELHQEWARPKRRLWHNDDFSPDMMNGKTMDEVRAMTAETRTTYVEAEKDPLRYKTPQQIMAEEREQMSKGATTKQLTYAEQLAAAKAAKAGGGSGGGGGGGGSAAVTAPPAVSIPAPAATSAKVTATTTAATTATTPQQSKQPLSYAEQLKAAQAAKAAKAAVSAGASHAAAPAAPAAPAESNSAPAEEAFVMPKTPAEIAAAVRQEAAEEAARVDAEAAEKKAKWDAAKAEAAKMQAEALAEYQASQQQEEKMEEREAEASVPTSKKDTVEGYAEKLAAARAKVAASSNGGSDNGAPVAPPPAPPAAAAAAPPAQLATAELAGGSFLATAVADSGGDLATLRERLLGALTLVDQMMAFQGTAAGGQAPPPPPPPQQQQQQQQQGVPPTTTTTTTAAPTASAEAQATAGATPSPPPPPTTTAAPVTAAPTNSNTAPPSIKPLDELATDKVRKAMALLVKHRGGGPFGAGRLSTAEEVQELEDSLAAVLGTLRDVDFDGLDPETGNPKPSPAAAAAAAAAPGVAVVPEKTASEQAALESHVAATGSTQAHSTYMEQLTQARAAKAAKKASS